MLPVMPYWYLFRCGGAPYAPTDNAILDIPSVLRHRTCCRDAIRQHIQCSDWWCNFRHCCDSCPVTSIAILRYDVFARKLPDEAFTHSRRLLLLCVAARTYHGDVVLFCDDAAYVSPSRDEHTSPPRYSGGTTICDDRANDDYHRHSYSSWYYNRRPLYVMSDKCKCILFISASVFIVLLLGYSPDCDIDIDKMLLYSRLTCVRCRGKWPDSFRANLLPIL